jgi:hypothetical protein
MLISLLLSLPLFSPCFAYYDLSNGNADLVEGQPDLGVVRGYIGSEANPRTVVVREDEVATDEVSVARRGPGDETVIPAVLELCMRLPFAECGAVTCAERDGATVPDCWVFAVGGGEVSVNDDPEDDGVVWTTYVRRLPLPCGPVTCESLPWSDALVRECVRDRETPAAARRRRSLWPISATDDDPNRTPWLLALLTDIRRRDRTPRRPCADLRVGELSVLTGCADDWRGREAWASVDRIAARHANESRWRAEIQGDVGYDQRPLSTLLDARAAHKPYYVFDTMEDHPGELDLYDTPPLFARADLYSWRDNLPHDYGPVRWLAFGSATGTGTIMHLDPLGIDAWNTLFSGYKYWFIFDPNVTAALGPHLRCAEGRSTAPLTGWTTTGGTPFVLGGALRALLHGDPSLPPPIEVLQAPGETIYVPRGYLHGVFNFGETVAVTEGHAMSVNGRLVWYDHLLPHLCAARAWRHLHSLYYGGTLDPATRHLARVSACTEGGPSVHTLSLHAVQ